MRKARRPNEYDDDDYPSVRQIVEFVAAEYDLEPSEVLGPHRERHLVDARHLCMYLCRALTPYSYPKIAQVFKRDHTSVLHGVKRIRMTVELDKEYGQYVKGLMESVRQLVEAG